MTDSMRIDPDLYPDRSSANGWARETMRAVDQLAEPGRSAVKLIYWAGATQAQAADVLAIGLPALRTSLAKALCDLGNSLLARAESTAPPVLTSVHPVSGEGSYPDVVGGGAAPTSDEIRPTNATPFLLPRPTPPSFGVEVNASPNRCEFAVRGELDLAVSQQLADIVLDCLDQTNATHVGIDLSAVAFLDSTGLGALVGIRNAALRLGRDVVLRAPSERAAKVLAVTGLDRVFTIAPR